MQITFDTTNVKDRQAIRALLDFLSQPNEAMSSNAQAILAATRANIDANDNPAKGLDTKELFTGTNVIPITLAPGVPPAPGVTPALDLDAEGLPWDERIHSSNKKKSDAGVWQLVRGAKSDMARINRIKQEIRATLALPAGAPAQTANVLPVFPQAQAAAPALTLPTPAPILPTAPVASLPQLPAEPSPLPAPVVPTLPPKQPETVADLMGLVGPAIGALRMPPTALQDACTKLGIPNLNALVSANRPDLVQALWKELQPLTV